MAAPHVAGVAALMASANPRLSAAELRALLLERAVRSPEAGRPGVVEALASVEAAMRTPSDPLEQPPTARILSAAVTAVPSRSADGTARRETARRAPDGGAAVPPRPRTCCASSTASRA